MFRYLWVLPLPGAPPSLPSSSSSLSPPSSSSSWGRWPLLHSFPSPPVLVHRHPLSLHSRHGSAIRNPCEAYLISVLGIPSRIYRIRMFLGLPDPDPLVRVGSGSTPKCHGSATLLSSTPSLAPVLVHRDPFPCTVRQFAIPVLHTPVTLTLLFSVPGSGTDPNAFNANPEVVRGKLPSYGKTLVLSKFVLFYKK